MHLREFVHSPAITCGERATLAEVAEEMEKFNVGSIVVLDANGHLAGIVTDRDLALRGIGKRREPGTPVAEIMTKNVVSVSEDADIFDAAHQMAEQGCRRLPLVGGDGALKGVVAVDDLMLLFAHESDELAHAVAAEMTNPLPPS